MGLTQVLCIVAAGIMLLMGSVPMALLFGAFALFAGGVGDAIDNSTSIPAKKLTGEGTHA